MSAPIPESSVCSCHYLAILGGLRAHGGKGGIRFRRVHDSRGDEGGRRGCANGRRADEEYKRWCVLAESQGGPWEVEWLSKTRNLFLSEMGGWLNGRWRDCELRGWCCASPNFGQVA